MSLFPAYALSDGDQTATVVDMVAIGPLCDKERDSEGSRVQLCEAALLASDEDSLSPPPAPPHPAAEEEFYWDGKGDNANIGVSTLYFPGRPKYERSWKPLPGSARGVGGGGYEARYFLQSAPPEDRLGVERERVARQRAFRDLLAGRPEDPDLWGDFCRFQEEFGSAAEWLQACEEATSACGDGGGGGGAAALRAERHRARRALHPARKLIDLAAEDLQKLPADASGAVRLELWLRLAWAVAEARGPGPELASTLLRACDLMPHEPSAYPLLLYVHGAALRAAGLWERLVQLLELFCAMNFQPSDAFPPPHAPPDPRLLEQEDAALASGLPLHVVWARVERLRAARHWRPAPPGVADADPERAPPPAEAAPLLRAVRPQASLLACIAMLRLAQVPLLPASCATAAAWGGAPDEAEPLAAALPALWRARRRLRPAQDAAALRRSLPALLDPPHAALDAPAAWTRALWDACAEWSAPGGERLALACWRLRWMHALAPLAPGAARVAARRAEARRVLRAAGGEPLAFALFARLEAQRGDVEEARRVALQAARAACGAADVPREHALFCARVLLELGAQDAGRAARVAAALGRPLGAAPECPSAAQEAAAAALCAERCEDIQRRLEDDDQALAAPGSSAALVPALTCGAGEWQAARVALLPREARAAELAGGLRPARPPHPPARVAWREARAVALALGTGLLANTAHLLRAAPHNALLALAHAERPAWRGADGAAGGAAGGATGGGTTARLAEVLEPLLRAPLDAEGSAGAAADRLARRARRAARDGDAALGALRLEAEARAGADVRRATYGALHHHPYHKWLYVRGAAWSGAEGGALAEALEERGLRAHALLPELRALRGEGAHEQHIHD